MNDGPSLPFASEEQISGASQKWLRADRLPSAHFLRLAVLRDLYRALHAHKSHCLATGRKDEAVALKSWETRIEELRHASQLTGDLLSLLRQPQAIRKKSHVLPQNIFDSIPREKLERYDRVWEFSLAAEACSQGSNFWGLSAWVKVPEVENWGNSLSSHIWPEGVVLFTDSLGFEEDPTQDPSKAIWQGQWTVILDSRFANPSELSFDFQNWAGFTGRDVAWKLLYAPPSHFKRR